MDIRVLDDFPAWSIYPLAVIAAGVLILSSWFLLRSAKSTRRRSSRRPRFSGPALVALGISGFVVWLLGTSMFFEFHAVVFEPDRVDLTYFWPRPMASILTIDIVRAEIVPGSRTCGHMLIATSDRVFQSVNFKKCTVAKEILTRLHRRPLQSARGSTTSHQEE
jgi:hypothetical protein